MKNTIKVKQLKEVNTQKSTLYDSIYIKDKKHEEVMHAVTNQSR